MCVLCQMEACDDLSPATRVLSGWLSAAFPAGVILGIGGSCADSPGATPAALVGLALAAGSLLLWLGFASRDIP